MKSYGEVWRRIVLRVNLEVAWFRVKRGHAHLVAVLEFERMLERDLTSLQNYLVKTEATLVAPIREGVPFLGLRIWREAWRLPRSRFLRTRGSFAERTRQFENGEIDETRYAQCATSADGALRWFGFKSIFTGNLALGEGSTSGVNRVKRGGSWNDNASDSTSSNQNSNPSNTNNNLDADLQEKGSHPSKPAPQLYGDEHARTDRPVAFANGIAVCM